MVEWKETDDITGTTVVQGMVPTHAPVIGSTQHLSCTVCVHLQYGVCNKSVLWPIVHSKRPSHGFVQVLRKITDIVAVEASHGNSAIHCEINVCLFGESFGLTRVQTGKATSG